MSAEMLASRLCRLMVEGGARPEPPEPGSGPQHDPPPDQGPSALVLLVMTALLVIGLSLLIAAGVFALVWTGHAGYLG